MDDILEGWTLKQVHGGDIIVQHSDGSGVVVRDGDDDSIAAAILHRLASDLIERASA